MYWTGAYQGVECPELMSAFATGTAGLSDYDFLADDDLLDIVNRVALLGSGDTDSSYPTTLEQYYRREITEWRVML